MRDLAGLGKYKGAELRKVLSDAGVGCVSSHFGIDELRKDQARAIAWAKEVGLDPNDRALQPRRSQESDDG